MARSPKVVIVGGGLGGAAPALALHRRGIDVAVYEKAPELTEIGAGLNLSPNALKAFRHLGIEDAVVAVGFQTKDQVIRSFRSGRVIARTKRSGDVAARYGAEFLTIHRADLLDTLSGALPDGMIRLGASCRDVESHDNGAVAHFADGSSVEADVVIGADGIHSVVRDSLFGPIEPRFTGCICWRGLVPREALADPSYGLEMTAWWAHTVMSCTIRCGVANLLISLPISTAMAGRTNPGPMSATVRSSPKPMPAGTGIC